jgi:phosphinothricin acetyltransferase
MGELRIRVAEARDLDAINAIYNHCVERSTCTFQVEPVSAAERASWFAEHGEAHPVTVAEREGEVVGWGALSPHKGRCAYRHTVEPSVYVHQDLLGQGIGRALLGDLIARARAVGHHTMVGGVCSENAASLALCREFGFLEVGHLREVGRKFERWLDVVLVQLQL